MKPECVDIIRRYKVPIGGVPAALGIPDADFRNVRVYITEEELVVDLFFEPIVPIDRETEADPDFAEVAAEATGEPADAPADEEDADAGREADAAQAAKPDGEQAEKTEDPPKGGALAKRAGIICNEGAFRTFLNLEHQIRVADADEAADWLREHCGVKTRAALDHDDKAGGVFRELDRAYTVWMTAD